MSSIAVIAACLSATAQEPWKGYAGGIEWEESFDAARNRAMEENKPILLHQLVGDLDKEGC